MSTFRVAIPETIRGVGVYAVVDDQLWFVPRDLIESFMDAPSLKHDTYVDSRSALYTACAVASGVYDREREVGAILRERLAPFGCVADALEHRASLATDFRDNGIVELSLPTTKRLVRSMTLDELSTQPPAAVDVFPPPDMTAKEILVHGTGDDMVRFCNLEHLSGIGDYISVDARFMFVPMRVMGKLGAALAGAPTAAAADEEYRKIVLRLCTLEDERAGHEIPFSRRVARFDALEGVRRHRTRMAATFLLPANPTLTPASEARWHYVAEGVDCDRGWRAAQTRHRATLN